LREALVVGQEAQSDQQPEEQETPPTHLQAKEITEETGKPVLHIKVGEVVAQHRLVETEQALEEQVQQIL
jgi:hypothetical protein